MDSRILFAGPSLAAGSWDDVLPWFEVRPPAQRGDFLAALAGGPATLVLLDGYYFDVPAVTHKEILYALECGVRVIGAASMGALRAAETAGFGMVGVGTVFAWYRDGVIDGDDEVAILHTPVEQGYRPLTVALVEVRAALGRLVERGAVVSGEAAEVVAALKALAFTARSPETVAAIAARHLGEAGAARLEKELAGHSVKREDARLALVRALEPARPALSPPARRSPPTRHFTDFRERYFPVPGTGEPPPTVVQACQAAQVLHPEIEDFVAFVRRRTLLAGAAARAGLQVSSRRVDELTAAARERLAAGLPALRLPVPELDDEARQCALAEAALEHFGGTEAALSFVAAGLGLAGRDAESKLVQVLESEPDLVPAWSLARALLLTSVAPLAVAVAERAAKVEACFRHWAPGRRIVAEDLDRLASEIWGCDVAEVRPVAAGRGLFASEGEDRGLYPALRAVAAAERLPSAINDYPASRAALRRTPLSYLVPSGCVCETDPAAAGNVPPPAGLHEDHLSERRDR